MDGLSLQKEVGTGPVSALLWRSKDNNFVKTPRDDGMLPDRELPPRLRVVSPVKSPRDDGMLPERALLSKLR